MSGKGKNRDDRKLPANDLDHRPGERVNDSTFRPREGMVLARSSFVGPMPPPELVAEYEEILPGAAKFFFSALDAQTTHRHMLEAKVVEANISNEKVGMWLAFTLAFTMIVCGTFLIYEDKDPQGLAMIAATLATLCGVFVYSRKQERKELKEKDPDNAE